eukprot:129720_1
MQKLHALIYIIFSTFKMMTRKTMPIDGLRKIIIDGYVREIQTAVYQVVPFCINNILFNYWNAINVSNGINHHEYKDDEKLQQWYNMSQVKLKERLINLLNKRIVSATQAINDAIKCIVQDTSSNHIWSALFPNKSIQKYNDVFPLFTVSNAFIYASLIKFIKKVDNWAGVDVACMNQPPKDFRKYYKAAGCWWHRHKAEFFGTIFFHPLLENILKIYIVSVTDKYTITSCNKWITKQDEQMLTREVLYFATLHKLLHTEITFARARPQPFILDQSFEKSKEGGKNLKLLFETLGRQHGNDWVIPPRSRFISNPLRIRNYARQWVQQVLQKKQQNYNRWVMKRECIIRLGQNDLWIMLSLFLCFFMCCIVL